MSFSATYSSSSWPLKEESNLYVPTQDVPKHKAVRRCMSVCDPLYGQIELPAVIRMLIDTPPVQRLRDLKQLGNSHYVYPGATNTRFEHSLGVCHLGMEFFRTIVRNHREDQRDFGIPELAKMSVEEEQKEAVCVGIAGLCHDLGHGPLSHLFERYVHTMDTDAKSPAWTHESASLKLLKSVWEMRRVQLEEQGYGTHDLEFVMLLIEGLKPEEEWPEEKIKRPPWKRFITDIVANKRSGLDVDKLDYIQRDSVACLGGAPLTSLQRLFQGSRVVVLSSEDSAPPTTTIGFLDKIDGYIEEVFLARSRLHRIVYQHRVTKILDFMALDALFLAGENFKVPHREQNEKGEFVIVRKSLMECVKDVRFYVQLSDWIFSALLHSGEEELEASREVLRRINRRDLYTTIGFYRRRDLSTQEAAAITAENLLAHVRDEEPDLYAKLVRWERENCMPGDQELRSIVQLEAPITQVAGDMKKNISPLDQIYFFSSRANLESGIMEPHPCRNVTTSMVELANPITAFTMVCRAPLTREDGEALRRIFEELAEEKQVDGATVMTATPHKTRNSVRRSTQGSARTGSPTIPVIRLTAESLDEEGMFVTPPMTMALMGKTSTTSFSDLSEMDVDVKRPRVELARLPTQN